MPAIQFLDAPLGGKVIFIFPGQGPGFLSILERVYNGEDEKDEQDFLVINCHERKRILFMHSDLVNLRSDGDVSWAAVITSLKKI